MQPISAVPAVIEGGGEGAVGHVGLHALGSFADRLGVPATLSAAVPWGGERAPLHDRGKVLTQAMLMLAGGGSSCADIEHLRVESRLFGFVASDSTTYRTFREVGPAVLADLHAAFAAVRRDVWARSSVTNRTGPVVLDIDASLVQIHSENKTGTSATYKGGFGFHPMFCFADAIGEALAAVLRAGNAGANTVADHVTVLDQAIGQLPAPIGAGHRCGDNPDLVARQVVVRADSAGCTHGFLAACRQRNVGFYVTARSNPAVTAAISDSIGVDAWTPAIDRDGRPRTDGAAVCELTSLIDDSRLPAGTRLIVRREPLHPGAQRSLFPSLEYRYWGFYTDQDGDPVECDATMRAHAHVEQHIQRLKDSGLCRFPFNRFDTNQAWLQTVTLAADLVRWFQLVCLPDTWADVRPKKLRWTLFGAPGRLVRTARQTIVRLIDDWPTAGVLVGAYQRIALIA